MEQDRLSKIHYATRKTHIAFAKLFEKNSLLSHVVMLVIQRDRDSRTRDAMYKKKRSTYNTKLKINLWED